MFKFIGKFEFKPLSSMYPKGTPERRRADNVEKALRNPNVRDRVLRKMHKQSFSNRDYNPFTGRDDLENAQRALGVIDRVEDGYDFINDPDYLIEKLDENEPFDIYSLLNIGRYRIPIEGDFPRFYSQIEKPNNRNNNSVPTQFVNQLQDLTDNHEQQIANLIQETLEGNGRYTINKKDPYTIESIVEKIKSGRINMDQYDSMIDWEKTDSDDIELYLEHLSPNTVERIKKDYVFDEQDMIDMDDLEYQIKKDYPEPHIIAVRNEHRPLNLLDYTRRAPRYIEQYIYDIYNYPYANFLTVRDFD